ncbi:MULTISPECIES: hypothetical protein [Dyadobacter]|jgi:hypothetical protein|uniref:Uncharacterized protein n=1 Tax=Dyadobacter chenhuakuii TaxID=2909339 RepID=A0A9X1QBQ7_9BACT|nr:MULTISPECIES: hypothetical protein [Dyadobacter]MCF2498883.1 hypothetical protein [Dyadobacter chenhuakuii]MCF2517808.1 hypothetical protein [Dyadobacter sp. CY351]
MKCNIFWLVLFCTGPQLLHAQSLRLGYFGETITHYGLRLAYEKPIATSISARNAKRILYGSLGVSGYRHPQNHIGLIVSPEVGFRRIGKKGALFEFALSPAYFRYFLEGKTYEATSDGDFDRVRFAGGNAFMPTVSLGVGHDLSVRKKVPLAWYVRLNLMQQRPYNTSNLIRFALEAGTLIPLKKR